MGKKNRGLTRRDLLRGAVGAALAAGAGAAAGCEQSRAGKPEAEGDDAKTRSAKAAKKRQTAVARSSRVVLVRDRKVLDDRGNTDPDRLAGMLDRAVCRLLDEDNPAVAWARLVGPGDTVGIKSNHWRFLPTPRELEEAIRQRVTDAGVGPERVAVDDRGLLDNPVFGKATALINVRPLRTHHWSGVGSLIKNYIMFSPAPWTWHDDACADLAKLWKLPQVEGKTRLCVLVMLTPLFHGKGPHHFNPRYTWPYKGLIVSTDPVAADATGLRVLEAKRRAFFGRGEPLAVSARHVHLAAARHGLGVDDPARIELVKLGFETGRLI